MAGPLAMAVEIFDLVPPENLLDEKQQQSLLYSSDLELGETTQRIFEAVERSKPKRVVIDSLSEIRLACAEFPSLSQADFGVETLFLEDATQRCSCSMI